MKIYLATFKHWPGVYNCFYNIKNIIEENFSDAKVVLYPLDIKTMNNFIINFIKKDPPDILFLGGWDNSIKTILLNCPKKTKTILYWCSPITQVDLSDELSRFEEVYNLTVQNKINNFILPLESDYLSFKNVSDKIGYIPIYIDLNDLEKYKIDTESKSNDIFKADFFCAPCARKNILNQISSMFPYKDKIKLFFNYDKNSYNSMKYINFAEKYYKNIENCGWMEREVYLNKIQEMDIGMQVTLSESFNYVVAEHLYFGIPILISGMSPFAKRLEKYGLVIKNVQDSNEISKAIERIVFDGEGKKISSSLKEEVLKENIETKNLVINSIREIIEK